MPRIAVALLVVLTIGVSIGVNLSQFPIVWDMMNGPREQTSASKPPAVLPAPAPPTVRAPRSERAVDLSEYAPPTVRSVPPNETAPRQEKAPAAPEPLVSHETEPGSPPPWPAEGSMRLVSESSSADGGGVNRAEESAWPSRAAAGRDPDATDLVAVGDSSNHGAAHVDIPQMPPPIMFSPDPSPATTLSDQTLSEADGSTVPPETMPGAASAAATTWPAVTAPSLKLGAKPPISDEPTGESEPTGDWREERPLVPIVWPEDRVAAVPSPAEPPPPSLQRFPKVLPVDLSILSEMRQRRPDSPIPIYPSTGK